MNPARPHMPVLTHVANPRESGSGPTALCPNAGLERRT